MKKITFLLLILCFAEVSFSQNCKSNKEYGTYPAQNSGFVESVSTTAPPGQYMTVTGILEDQYTFTATHSVVGVGYDDYITITDSSNNILAQDYSPLTYTVMPGDISGGTLRLHLYLDDSCNTDDLNITVTLLNETEALTTCQEIENPRVSYRSDTRIDIYWDPPSVGDTPASYDWEAVPAGSSQGEGDASGNTTTTSASATGLTPGISYTFYIMTNCVSTGSSGWYQTPPLSTNAGPPPANDYCDGAISVLEDTGTDVGSATAIDGTLLNTAGTDEPAEQCSGNSVDNARDDVWYSFLAQTDDINITVDPSFNAIVTLFSGTCGSLSLLACSDNSVGAAQEEISYGSLIVGQTYYFRVYYQGFSTSSPDFTVKVWSSTVTIDADMDGYSVDVDCDDNDPDVNPGTVWYLDADGDNYAISTVAQCSSPGMDYTTTVLPLTDCDDDDVNVNPGTTEVCDGVDNNCDGQVDEGFDADDDGVADCFDICPGYDDTLDADGDGVPDGCDICPGFDDTVDTDGDGTPDCNDNCPGDPNKVDPGTCGCGVADTDTDGDGTADCNDLCPGDPDKVDP